MSDTCSMTLRLMTWSNDAEGKGSGLLAGPSTIATRGPSVAVTEAGVNGGAMLKPVMVPLPGCMCLASSSIRWSVLHWRHEEKRT